MKIGSKVYLLVPALAAGLALLAGCPSGTQTQSSTPPPTARAAGFHGTVFGGRQPIVGAKVVAYESGATTGADRLPRELGSATTDMNGRFTIAFGFIPHSNRLIYLVAKGGTSITGGGINTATKLLTVAGIYCTSGSTGCNFPDTVNINELTTVASTAVLQDYLAYERCSSLIGNTESGSCIGLRGAAGLVAMGGTVGNLVNVATGRPSDFLAAQPNPSPLHTTLEKINTLANVLASCVNTSGTESSPSTTCQTLFDAALGIPADTLKTALLIATSPVLNGEGQKFFALAGTNPVYSPVLPATPPAASPGFWTVGGERYVLAVNSDGDDVSVWTFGEPGASGGTGGSFEATGTTPHSIAVDPGGRYVYVANTGSGNLSAYAIGTDGRLVELLTSPFTAGASPRSVAVDPSGHYVYVVNFDDDNVSAYAIGAGGALTEIAGSPFAAGDGPDSVAIDPTGSYLYTANFAGNNVSAYIIGAGGALANVAGAGCYSGGPTNCFAAGTAPFSIAADPTGNYVYVANLGGGNISAYAIGTGGLLAGIAGASCYSGGPTNCFAAGTAPDSVAVDPSGRFLYVANGNSDNVSAYAIGTGGGLTALADSPFAAGDDPIAVAVDPTGHFVRVANKLGDSSSVFALDTLTGGLAPITGSPFPAGSEPSALAADPTGRYAYLTFPTLDGIASGTIGKNGGLDPVPGNACGGAPPVNPGNCIAAGANPVAVALDPSGRFVYVANNGSNDVSAYRIGTGGVFTEIAGSPFAAGDYPTSVAVVVGLTGRFLYVTNYYGNDISVYTIGADGALSPLTLSACAGVTSLHNCVAAGSNPRSITVFRSGYVYVANFGGDNVSAYAIQTSGYLATVSGNPCGDTPDPHNCFAAGNAPVAVANDPGASYVYAANYGSNNVSAYSVGVGGVLTELTGSPFTAGDEPRSVTVDPTGNHVYVANYGENDVSGYTIGTGGGLTELSSSPFAAGSAPFSITVDPTGRYVYVANHGNANVSVYGIGGGGVLSPISADPCGVVPEPGNCFAAGDIPVSIAVGP